MFLPAQGSISAKAETEGNKVATKSGLENLIKFAFILLHMHQNLKIIHKFRVFRWPRFKRQLVRSAQIDLSEIADLRQQRERVRHADKHFEFLMPTSMGLSPQLKRKFLKHVLDIVQWKADYSNWRYEWCDFFYAILAEIQEEESQQGIGS